jgi:Glycosyl transferases group 1
MADVLIVYSAVQWPLVGSLRDALYSFERHSRARCWYLNLAVRRVPRWLRLVPFDAVVFQTTLLWDRVNPPLLERHLDKLRRLRGVGRHRVALPQDEYLHTRGLVRLINELEIDHVFSVGPEAEWDKLYEGLDRHRVGMSRVLTGYLADETVSRIEAIVRAQGERNIAIGYRAARLPPSLGRHGWLKTEIANRVSRAGAARGLALDVATGPSATIRGDDWYRFLANCRYTIGVEGGASLHDPDGAIQDATNRYLRTHRGASFEEVEANCFPGRDGAIEYVAISPRHLEACATRTAQVLIEGGYNGILRPGEHYIELRRDFSNLERVLDLIENDEERARLTEAAYRDVVASGAYTYERLVREVEAVALADAPSRADSHALDLLARWAQTVDRLSWIKVAAWVRIAGGLRAFALRTFPEPALAFIRRRVAGTAAETAALQSAE